MRRLAVALFLLTLAAGFWAHAWLDQPLRLREAVVDLRIAPGTNARQVASQAAQAGVEVLPLAMQVWFRLSGQAHQIQAGVYELRTGVTPRSLLAKLVSGEQALRQVTLVEGWTFAQVRQALLRSPDLKPASQGLTESALMANLGRPGSAAEGRFFPDTYRYAKNSADLEVLAAALSAMDRQLEQVWQARDEGLALSNPDELLTLASLVEKETGLATDRGMIARVFHNRLLRGMPLQSDPTVIYGLGGAFDGNLRRPDLRRDTAWNTYTRAGLPVTPIAMPGRAALLAAAQPASGSALYFVSRGDGSSEFSETLEAHNRAVNRFQRRQ